MTEWYNQGLLGINWDDPRTQYYAKAVLGGLPIIGPFFQAFDKINYMDDYMENRGLDWSSVKYPSMTVGYQGVSGLTNFVSSNIMRLYK